MKFSPCKNYAAAGVFNNIITCPGEPFKLLRLQ